MKRVRLPGNRWVWCTTRGHKELEVVYEEVFGLRTYEQHGVHIDDGNVVVDAGANVGLFALSVLERRTGLRLVCIEPAPPTRACLERNLEMWSGRNGHEITTLPWALGASEGETTIEFLPGLPANSSVHPEDKRTQIDTVIERFTVKDLWLSNKSRPWAALGLVLLTLITYPFRRWLYRGLVRIGMRGSTHFPCRVRPLAAVLQECSVTRVDLLKVDVEGAELEVLEGLGDAGLALVRQLAIEFEPYHKDRLPALMDRLRSCGFEQLSLQSPAGRDDVLADPFPCMLYAVRPSRGAAAAAFAAEA